MNRVLFYFTVKYEGDWESIYNALSSKESIEKKELNKVLLLRKNNYLCLIDFTYPENLKFIYKPPFSLFWEGNFNLFSNKLISLFSMSQKDFINLKKMDNIIKSKISFVVDYNEKNLINFLISNQFNFICVTNHSIRQINQSSYFKKIVESNNLVISEYPNNFKNKTNDNSYLRIISGISRRVFIGSKNNIYLNTRIKEICSMDQIEIFTFNKNIDLNFDLLEKNNCIQKS